MLFVGVVWHPLTTRATIIIHDTHARTHTHTHTHTHTQVLFKSSRVVPTMLFGIVFMRKKHSSREIAVVLMMVRMS